MMGVNCCDGFCRHYDQAGQVIRHGCTSGVDLGPIFLVLAVQPHCRALNCTSVMQARC
jgi:hypothetical protein